MASTNLEQCPREHLVADTGVFIRLKRLENFGYRNIHVVEGVAGEIRDEAARRQLQFSLAIPKISAPTEKDVSFVRQFARMTGDLGFLSETDINVIALTYMLQRMTGDVSRLKSRPEWKYHRGSEESVRNILDRKNWGIREGVQGKPVAPAPPAPDPPVPAPPPPEVAPPAPVCSVDVEPPPTVGVSKSSTSSGGDAPGGGEGDFSAVEQVNCSAPVPGSAVCDSAGTVVENVSQFASPELSDREECLSLYSNGEDADEDGSEAGDWLGEDNLDMFLGSKQEVLVDEEQPESMRVACVTTDFSIQNVLLEMGLSVLSVDGYRIRQTRKWVLLCRGCRAITMDTTRRFCPECGNMTVHRAPATVNADGKVIVEDNRRPFNPRGKIYSIPKPRGGRQGDLILCEDQLFIGGRDRLFRHQQKLQQKERAMRNPFNPDTAYEQQGWWARNPISQSMKNIQIGLGPGNPNSNRWQKRRNRKR